ncbi:MAG: HAMP domain-containing sensor histidine kinase, partial [Thermoanaerobaculia bacterium]
IPAMERRAEDAHRFAVNLSHELRTPLAAIRGAAEILSESRPGAEDQERFLGNILTESERLERLVEGLLDLERGPGAHKTEDALPDPAIVVDEIVARCAPLLQSKSLRVEFEQAPSLPTISVDKRRLERILFGLLENAIKFSPEGGRVTVRIRSREDDLLVEIEDEGPGVPAEFREEIFDRHFTAGRGGASGTGLGLAIVRSLTTAVGGSVWADETVDGGALFCCILPAAKIAPQPSSD